MIVGINPAGELKEISKKENKAFSDVLLQFVQEDILQRIEAVGLSEAIWVEGNFPWENKSEKVRLIYRHKEGTIVDEEKISEIVSKILAEKNELEWQYSIRRESTGFVVGVEAAYREMKIPLTVIIHEIEDMQSAPVKKSFKCMLRQIKQVSCNIYSPEAEMSDYLFEIFEKLELISDMKPYSEVNKILKTRSVSGRHIMEGMSDKIQVSPKVLKEKRLNQLVSYKEYTYMKKRWEKYCKSAGESLEDWNEVITRITDFAGPIWKALCNNEIFFDDWMPELGRFLG